MNEQQVDTWSYTDLGFQQAKFAVTEYDDPSREIRVSRHHISQQQKQKKVKSNIPNLLKHTGLNQWQWWGNQLIHTWGTRGRGQGLFFLGLLLHSWKDMQPMNSMPRSHTLQLSSLLHCPSTCRSMLQYLEGTGNIPRDWGSGRKLYVHPAVIKVKSPIILGKSRWVVQLIEWKIKNSCCVISLWG